MTQRWRSREELTHQIVTLARDGMSRRAIARALDVSRNTVKVVLAAHGIARETEHTALPPRPARAPRATKFDAFKPRIAELIARFPDITAQRVFETLRDEGFQGGYTAIKEHVRTVRPAPKPAPSLPSPEYGPGEMAGSDWSPYTVRFERAGLVPIHAFTYTLAFSTRKYLGIYDTNDGFALMDGHECAFRRFKGCARTCRYDGQSPVVARWEGKQPIYNPRFLAFAAHYEFRPSAVRGNPNANPRAERSFLELQRSFFNGRAFRDRDDLAHQLARWLDEIVDHRPRKKKTALERFAEEQDHLVPLPRHPYDTARVVYRLCGIDGFVDYDGNRYAVPYEHVTDFLPIRVTQHELFVYAADLRCVARHELAPRGQGLKLDPAGFHPPARRRSALDLDQLLVAFEGIGARAEAFFRLLSAGEPRFWGHQARRILLLRERFTTEDLDAALGHAARFAALDAASVERILSARAKPRTLDQYVAEETARRLEQTLGSSRATPRDLREYDRLPHSASPPSAPPSPPSHPEPSPCPSETPETTRLPPQPPQTTPPSSSDSDDTSSSSS